MKEISLMYTGGLDTTLAAFLLAKKFDKMHLLTFNFKSNLFINFSKKNVKRLKKLFGKKVVHRIININNLIKKVNNYFLKEVFYYKSPFIYELACRFAINVATLDYNLRNKIKHTADGSSIEQNHWPEQGQEYLKYVKYFFNNYGVIYLIPVYDFGSRRKRRNFLLKQGFKFGPKKFTNLSFFINSMQPFCIHDVWGSLFRRLNLFMLDENKVLIYMKQKERRIKNYLKNISILYL